MQGHGVEALRAVRGNRDQPGGPLRGKFKEGDTCWLCSGKKKTMCGNCVDLTDSF